MLVPISLGLVLCGGYLVQLLYGHKYAGNGMVVAVLAVGVATNAAAFSYSRALFALNRANVDFGINIGSLVMTVTCGVVLIELLGPLGAACGLTGINAAGAVARVLTFHATKLHTLEKATS